MKNTLFSTTIALALFPTLIGIPRIAQATPKLTFLIAQQTADAPQIDNFRIDPVSRLTPGSELVFTLQGTPNAQATVTIGTVARNLPMREVEPGYYEARYTIRSSDQLSSDTIVRANLQRNDRVTSVRLQQPLVASTSNSSSSTSSTSSTPNSDRTTQTQAVTIDRFTVQPVQRLDPGTELNFTLVGTPNATATFSIDGVTYSQPMREVSSGTYQGQYVVRRQDVFPASGATVTASLQAGNQVVRARLDQTLTATDGTNSTPSTNSTSQLPLEILSPQNNSQVQGTIEVRGRSAPSTTVNVSVQAKTSLAGLVGVDRNIFSRTITTDAQGNFSFRFKPSIAIPGTRYEVSLNANNGNQTNQETLVLVQQ